MVDWQVTATTIYCDAVDDEVTVIVDKDWSLKCTGYSQYGVPGRGKTAQLKKKGSQRKRELGCEGLECQRVVRYREKLIAEEARKGQ